MKKVFLFLHIPKTAGTSFRKALESDHQFKMIYDYGEKSIETDANLKKIIKLTDAKAFDNLLIKDKINFLCGHVFYAKYKKLIQSKQILSILRNPVERVVSEFQHLSRHENFTGTFADFINIPVQINKQFRILNGAKLLDGGVFGLTSHYEYFLDLVKSMYGWNVESKRLNVAPSLDYGHRYHLSSVDVDQAYQLNDKDIEIFFKIADVFKSQLEKIGLNTIPPKNVNFNCRIVDNQNLVGWIARTELDCYLVALKVNGKSRAIVALNVERKDVHSKELSPSKTCGFSYPLVLLGAQPGDDVSMEVLGAPWCRKSMVRIEGVEVSHE